MKLSALVFVVAALFGPTLCAQAQPAENEAKTKKLAIVLFEGFETLDVFGPLQMWSRLKDYEVVLVTETGEPAKASQGYEVKAHYSFSSAPQFEIVMVPGGGGTRREINNPAMIDFIKKQDQGTEWTTSVCTGAALLARAGVLNGRKATTNKNAFEFPRSQDPINIDWQRSARWVVDGKYVTSSGISAGTDMALGLVELLYDREEAERIAHGAEYIWNDDPENDPFFIEE